MTAEQQTPIGMVILKWMAHLQTASETVAKLEQTESKLGKELKNAKNEIDSYIAQLEVSRTRIPYKVDPFTFHLVHVLREDMLGGAMCCSSYAHSPLLLLMAVVSGRPADGQASAAVVTGPLGRDGDASS